MKIGVIGPTYPFLGGISHYNTLLCENLAKKHDVNLISYKRRYPSFLYPGKEQIDKVSKEKIKTNAEYILDSINPITWIKALLKIKQKNPDLLILHWVTPFLAPMFFIITSFVRFIKKTKILFICHNVLPHEKRIVDKFLIKIVLRNADFLIVHSKEDLENLKSLIHNAKIRQTVHPIYEVFKFEKISKAEAKSRLKLKNKVILFFGFVREYKGLVYLIKAMPEVLERLDTTLLIVGEFWDDKTEYLNEINNLKISKNVSIIDKYVPNEDVGLYFSAADVVALPYSSATQSGIVQIAYGFNKPVITTKVGGIPDIVKNGKTGLVVEPKNSDALAEGIISYFENNKEKEIAENIKREKEKFSWDKLVEIIDGLGVKNARVGKAINCCICWI